MRIEVSLAGNTYVATNFDPDRNPSTIADARAVVVGIPPGGALVTLVVDAYAAVVPGFAITATYSAGVVQFSFPRETLGVDQGFNFNLVSASLDESSTAFDHAPNVGWWTYELTKPAPPPPSAAVKPVIGKPLATPAQPVAGKRFVVTFPVTRSDDGTPLVTGTVACTTKVAGKVVPHRQTFKAGQARATLVIPKAAKGKQLRIAVKVTAGNQAASKVVTYRIR